MNTTTIIAIVWAASYLAVVHRMWADFYSLQRRMPGVPVIRWGLLPWSTARGVFATAIAQLTTAVLAPIMFMLYLSPRRRAVYRRAQRAGLAVMAWRRGLMTEAQAKKHAAGSPLSWGALVAYHDNCEALMG